MSTRSAPLGAGLGWREELAAATLANLERVDFLEVLSDDHIGCPERTRRVAGLPVPVVCHGVRLSIGSGELPDPAYLERIARFLDDVGAVLFSEHLSFTRAGGIDVGHFVPIAYGPESLERVIAHTRAVTRAIAVPFLLENISKLFETPGLRMEETEFLHRLTAETGCFLLLDLTNVHANAANLGFDPFEYLADLPLDAVAQIHISGGHTDGALYIDSHAHPVPEEVWRLLEWTLERSGVGTVLLERDKNYPPIGALLDELDRARDLLGARPTTPAR